MLDPVGISEWFGTSPWLPEQGAVPLPARPLPGHTHYYDTAPPTLAAIGEVVAGGEAHP